LIRDIFNNTMAFRKKYIGGSPLRSQGLEHIRADDRVKISKTEKITAIFFSKRISKEKHVE